MTPTIRKARATVREHEVKRSMTTDLNSTGPNSRQQERAATAKTRFSVSTPSKSNNIGLMRRRDSRSAPAYTRNSRYSNHSKPSSASTTLPAIEDAWAPPIASNSNALTKSTGNLYHDQQEPNQQHVKFVFDNPLKILASSEESANLFAKSHPYYPGSMRAVNFGSDSSDEDDDFSLHSSEMIDLREILYGGGGGGGGVNSGIDDNGRSGATTMISGQHYPNHVMTPQQLAAFRKAQGPAPKLTLDMKQEEANYINTKINNFLQTLEIGRLRKRRPSEEEFMANYMTENEDEGNTKATSTADLMPKKTNTHNRGTGDNDTDERKTNTDNVEKKQGKGDTPPDVVEPSTEPATPRTKYSWRCIKGRTPDQRATLSSEDLVLQALTGVPISNMLNGHIPLNSASRAMRHTATFKMHKVVERLINERTKYERHQVEELKRQMEGSAAETDAQTITSGGSNNTIPQSVRSSVSRQTSRSSNAGGLRPGRILAK